MVRWRSDHVCTHLPVAVFVKIDVTPHTSCASYLRNLDIGSRFHVG